jgi:subtilisin family serine protease
MSEQDIANTRPLLINGEKLRVDVVLPPSGGGEKYEPVTAREARLVLLPKAQATLREAQALAPELRSDRVYVEARLLPNYLAASHFPGALLDRVDAVPVGSRVESASLRTAHRERTSVTRRLVLAVSDRGLNELVRIIDHPNNIRSEQQAFEEIRKLDDIAIREPASAIVARPSAESGTITWESVLHPAGIRSGELVPLGEETLAKWFALVLGAGGEVYTEYVRTVGGLTFVPIRLEAAVAESVATFNPLRALRPIPPMRPIPTVTARGAQSVRPPSTTDPITADPTVAVFDGGLESAGGSAFFPGRAVDLTTEAANPSFVAHGTGVGGAVMYGLTPPGTSAPQPPLPVDHYRVLPPPNVPGDLDGYWLLDRIKEIVTQGDYRLVNLSLGPQLAVEDTIEPNRWTSELDQLAWEKDVLFVVAAGNDGEQDPATGLHRVQVPGDMVNGLTIGACDSPSPKRPWNRAPYSSMGPGRHGNRVQPGGLQFGGSGASPFPVLTANGTLLDLCGTSFAAPVVTHALADLATQLPMPTANALRAFAVHFAERPRKHRSLMEEVGHGRLPILFRDCLECGPDEVHILFVDQIRRGDLLGYRLPLPSNIRKGAKVELTLCYASPTDPAEPTEYTRASLELSFRPHELLHRFMPPSFLAGDGAKPVILDITSDQARSLLQQGWKPSELPVTKALGATVGTSESARRDAGKWETVRHHRISLKADEVREPHLELSYLARRAGALSNEPTEVPFALLVTLRGEPGEGLYDKTLAQFPVLSRLPATVRTPVSARASRAGPGRTRSRTR